MMKRWICSIGVSVISTVALAQTKGDDEGILTQRAAQRDKTAIDNAVNGWWTASMRHHDERIAWWREARFGCFIHWGVYSVPGGTWKGKKVDGYAEHLMRKEKISRDTYFRELIQPFHPDKFDADAWVRTIHDAGMRYLIITAKHHDGVAMYPTAIGDYSILASGFKTDPMLALSKACKKYGIRFGFYYSHAFDWEHPDAPGNDWDYDNPGGDKLLHGGTGWYDTHPELLPKAIRYVNEKAIPQIKELLTKYHPDILWFDTPHKLPLSENIRILQAIRSVDSTVVVNGRLARSSNISFGDYKNTADRPAAFYPVTGDWEAIPTTNESYGYSRYDSSHKPAGFLIRLLAQAAARGGNLLMNIGPQGNGVIDPRDTIILHRIGQWMERNGESIYGTTATPLPIQPWGVSTRKGNQLYLHVFRWPQQGKLYVGGLLSKVEKAYLLTDKKKTGLHTTPVNDRGVTIQLPAHAPDTINSVVVLQLKNIQTDSIRVLDAAGVNQLHAFDAQQHGKGLKYADGKQHQDYVFGWNKPEQALSWTFRLTAPVRYHIHIKAAPAVFQILADGKPITGNTLELPAGTHTIRVLPEQPSTESLIKFYEIILSPST